MLTFVLLAVWLIAAGAPETAIGGALRRATVEWPARKLGAIRRGHVIAGAALMVLVGLVAWFGEGDGIRMLAMGVPDLAASLAMMDVASLAEAALAMVLTIGSGGLRGWRIGRPRPSRPTPRARRVRGIRRPAANDDEDGGALRRVG